MPRLTAESQLLRLLGQLKAERQTCVERIAKIDELLAKAGGTVSVTVKRGRPVGSTKAGKRRKRGKFDTTGEQSVLGFIKKHGKPNAAEVNKHWQTEGRGGKADNTLTRLVGEKLLKRVSVKGERGGRYELA